jgi:periplasmic divalent cation tolerance protein
MTDYIQMMTTTGSRSDAQKIAQVLVEQRLAGCVQIIGPILSTYWWDDKLEQNEEFLCLIKTEAGMFDRMAAAISEVHPYDMPEILAVPVVRGSEGYLRWLSDEIHHRDGPGR